MGRLVRLLQELWCGCEVQGEDRHQGGPALGSLLSHQPQGGGDLSGGRLSGGRRVEQLEQVGLLLQDLWLRREVPEPELY